MTKRDGAAKKISCKSKRRYRNKNITSNRTLYGKYTKPLRHVGIEEIAKVTGVDEYSKKLNLPAHLLTMVHFVIEDCKSLTELCGSLKGKHGKTHGLSSITKGQLSTVNRNRDYRVFVWIFSELLYQVIHRYHALKRVSKELLVAGIDATSIIFKAQFSTFGYCASTKTIEQGIKIHLGAVLGKFTIPITAMITPMNVSDSNEFDNILTDMGLFVDLHKVILVFDKGYWCYQRFKDLSIKGIRFIVPMKKGAKCKVLSEKKTKKIYSDMKNIEFDDMPGMVFRLVITHTKEEEDLEYLTNIFFDLTPEQIKECYESRWDMEVLNKELKSNLKIENFIGESLNAVLIQIFCTLITYLLIALFRITYNSLLPVLEIKRLLRYYGIYTVKKVRELNPKSVTIS